MSQKERYSLSRRVFMKRSTAAGLAVTGAVLLPKPAVAQPRQNTPAWAHAFPSFVDEKTGVTVYSLTPGGHDDRIVYQTHPAWTQDMRYFMFYSTRSGGGARPHLLDMETGGARPIFAEGHQRETMTWHNDNFYCMVNHEVCVVDVIKRYHNEDEPRTIGRIPEALQRYSGDITVDADGSALYFGIQLDESEAKYAVAAMNLASGETRLVVETDFKVGHFQANPVKPGQIMFCWETGGDAPQRTWRVNADGSDLKPMYKETYNEWVTHEVWWGGDHIIFTIWPYNDAMRAKPHGIAEASTETGPDGELNLLTQYPAWHTHGSRDRKWALGDDFDRNIWFINTATRERKLLTQGHNAGEYKTHPHGSFTPDNKGLVFTSSRNGVEDIFYVPLPEWETLA